MGLGVRWKYLFYASVNIVQLGRWKLHSFTWGWDKSALVIYINNFFLKWNLIFCRYFICGKDVFNNKNILDQNVLLTIYNHYICSFIYFYKLSATSKNSKKKKLKTPLTRFKVFFLSLFLQSNNWWGTNFPKFIKILRIWTNMFIFKYILRVYVQLFLLTNISI